MRPTFLAVSLSPDGEIRGIEVVGGEGVVALHQRCDVTFKDCEQVDLVPDLESGL